MMIEGWMIVVAMVGAASICAIVFGVWWKYFMPGYVDKRIKGVITEYTQKSCFNCEHFSEQYQDGWLYCGEIGLNLYKVQNKCRIWKLRSFGELDAHNDALRTVELWAADNFHVINEDAPDGGSAVVDVLDLLDTIDKTRVQKGLAIPEETPMGGKNASELPG